MCGGASARTWARRGTCGAADGTRRGHDIVRLRAAGGRLVPDGDRRRQGLYRRWRRAGSHGHDKPVRHRARRRHERRVRRFRRRDRVRDRCRALRLVVRLPAVRPCAPRARRGRPWRGRNGGGRSLVPAGTRRRGRAPRPRGGPIYPVVHVSWHAAAYCAWAGVCRPRRSGSSPRAAASSGGGIRGGTG